MASSTRSAWKTLFFACALACFGAAALLLTGEIVVRIKYAIANKDANYLVLGILPDQRRVRAVGTSSPAVMRSWSDCTKREVEYRSNSVGGRGPEWNAAKAPGTIRILAAGESVTRGVGQPEELTWVTLLEQSLRANFGIQAEVLNWGLQGGRIDLIEEKLPAVLDKYRPDIVLFYGGFNTTWSNVEVPGILPSLNYRSMLYTYIYEKLYFRAQASAAKLVPDLDAFKRSFEHIVSMTRGHNASLMLAAEATAAGAPTAERAACAQQWTNTTALRACLGAALDHSSGRFKRVEWARMYKTEVLEHVLTVVAQRENLPIVDPRPVLTERAGGPAIYCDEAHLTDEGNRLLAAELAAPVAEYIKKGGR